MRTWTHSIVSDEAFVSPFDAQLNGTMRAFVTFLRQRGLPTVAVGVDPRIQLWKSVRGSNYGGMPDERGDFSHAASIALGCRSPADMDSNSGIDRSHEMTRQYVGDHCYGPDLPVVTHQGLRLSCTDHPVGSLYRVQPDMRVHRVHFSDSVEFGFPGPGQLTLEHVPPCPRTPSRPCRQQAQPPATTTGMQATAVASVRQQDGLFPVCHAAKVSGQGQAPPQAGIGQQDGAFPVCHAAQATNPAVRSYMQLFLLTQ